VASVTTRCYHLILLHKILSTQSFDTAKVTFSYTRLAQRAKSLPANGTERMLAAELRCHYNQ